MNILHFAVDDKFIPFIQKTFEQAYPGCNEFRISGNPKNPLSFVIPGQNVQIKDKDYWSSTEIENDLKNHDCLIIHYMNRSFMEGIKRAHPNLLIVWIGWGGDYSYLIEPYLGEPLLENTKALINSLHSKPDYVLKKIKKNLKKLIEQPKNAYIYLLNRTSHRIDIHDVIERIDLLWINPEEFSLFKKALPGFHGEFHRINYYSSEETFQLGPGLMDGPDILVGNSSTETNNHLEIFKLLQNINLDGRKVIAPLSYGDMYYGDVIERIGYQYFGSEFMPIRHYMSIDEYHTLLSRCGTVVMNHVRQQAGTTIATALYKGAKVFMRAENPAYRFYKSMGVNLFSIQDQLNQNTVFGPLNQSEMHKHRSILDSYWSHKTAIRLVKELKAFSDNKKKPYTHEEHTSQI